jgi:hypothetical protein
MGVRSSRIFRFMPTNLLITTVCIILLEPSYSDELWTGIRSLPPGRNFSNNNNLAILHYEGASEECPTVNPTVNIPVSQMPLVETNLHVRVTLQRESVILTSFPPSPSSLVLW